MHPQRLVNKVLRWGLSVCHCRGYRRARDHTTDWALAQCPVHGEQTSFTLWTAQLYQSEVITGPDGDWCPDSWCWKSSHQQRAREMAAVCGPPGSTGRTARWGLVREVRRVRGTLSPSLCSFPGSTTIWPCHYLICLDPSFCFFPGKISQSHQACICHRIKWYETCKKMLSCKSINWNQKVK